MDSTLKNKMNRSVRVKNKAGKNSPLYKDNVEKEHSSVSKGAVYIKWLIILLRGTHWNSKIRAVSRMCVWFLCKQSNGVL